MTSPYTMALHTSYVGGTTPSPHNHQPFTSRQAILQLDTACNCAWVLKLINRRARLGLGLEGPGKAQRSHTAGSRPPSISLVKHHFRKQHRSHTHTWRVLTHAWTAHSRLGTSTILVRCYWLLIKTLILL